MTDVYNTHLILKCRSTIKESRNTSVGLSYDLYTIWNLLRLPLMDIGQWQPLTNSSTCVSYNLKCLLLSLLESLGIIIKSGFKYYYILKSCLK